MGGLYNKDNKDSKEQFNIFNVSHISSNEMFGDNIDKQEIKSESHKQLIKESETPFNVTNIKSILEDEKKSKYYI